MNVSEMIRTAPVVLTEGALIERLRRDVAVSLDPHVLHAGFIYDHAGREALRTLYGQYLEIGRAAGLPMIVGTPTWRASAERVRLAGLAEVDVNGDGVRFLASIRDAYGRYVGRVIIAGMMGCAVDAYRPETALSEEEAVVFHRPQAQALAAGGVDCLLAATLPHAGEARGLARAMAECEVPYMLSFVVRPDCTLLDGTPLGEAVAAIDAAAAPAPLCYLLNCVHPRVFEAALLSERGRSRCVRERVIGLQANASAKSPEELDGSPCLDSDPPEVLADAMLRLRRRFGTKILGGCCGTDNRHIACIARRAKECARPIL